MISPGFISRCSHCQKGQDAPPPVPDGALLHARMPGGDDGDGPWHQDSLPGKPNPFLPEARRGGSMHPEAPDCGCPPRQPALWAHRVISRGGRRARPLELLRSESWRPRVQAPSSASFQRGAAPAGRRMRHPGVEGRPPVAEAQRVLGRRGAVQGGGRRASQLELLRERGLRGGVRPKEIAFQLKTRLLFNFSWSTNRRD